MKFCVEALGIKTCNTWLLEKFTFFYVFIEIFAKKEHYRTVAQLTLLEFLCLNQSCLIV